MASERSATSLALSGLVPSVTESLVTNMFRTYGQILRVSIDGTGGGHVVFAKKANALKALPATNGAPTRLVWGVYNAQVLEGKPMHVTIVRGFTKTFQPCRSFRAGICRKGDDCKYLHNVEGAPKTSSSSAPVPIASTPKSIPSIKASTPVATIPVTKAPTPAAAAPVAAAIPPLVQNIPDWLVCRYFARGYCSLGTTCRYAHVRGVNAPAPEASTQPPAAAPTPAQPSLQAKTVPSAPAAPKRICQYFASGLCTRGEACAFSHDLPVTPVVKEKKVKAPKPVQASASAAAPVTAKTTQKQTKEESEEPVDVSRTCIECEKPGAATWQCAKCDDALYCESCNAAVHKSKVMRAHERIKLPEPVVVEKNPTCEECEETESSVRCKQCDVVLCGECDASVHKFKSLRSHLRKPIKQEKTVAAVAVENVKKPSPKKQKLSTTKAVDVPAAPQIAYVESVPKYDLTSESESESEKEDESDDEDERPIMPSSIPAQSVANAPAASSSSDDDEEEEDNKVKVAAAPAPAATHNAELSSESSDDDDERPVVLAAPLPRKAVAAKAAARPQPVVTVSSSESSSDEENTRPRGTSKPAATANSSSSSSSSDSSSDDSDDEDAKPQAQSNKPAPAPRNPPKATRGSANPGISSGSSHSLVKKIEAYYESGETEALHLDANLNGFERLLAHDCAERLGLQHMSAGEGLDRHITIFPAGATNKRAADGAQGGSAPKRVR